MKRYALVFGVNTLTALLLQTVLTVIVVDSNVLALDILQQVVIIICLIALFSWEVMGITLHKNQYPLFCYCYHFSALYNL